MSDDVIPLEEIEDALTMLEIALFGRIYAMTGEPALLRAQMDGKNVAVVVEVTAEAADRTQLAPLAVLVDDEMLRRLAVDGVPLQGLQTNDERGN